MTVEEAMAVAGLHDGRGGRVREAWLIAECPGCEREVRLSNMTQRESPPQTDYICPNCGAKPVTINPTDGRRGYLLKANVISVAHRMWIDIPGAAGRVLLPWTATD